MGQITITGFDENGAVQLVGSPNAKTGVFEFKVKPAEAPAPEAPPAESDAARDIGEGKGADVGGVI